ncbi:dTDP-4-dehydrorhamnose reductase [Salegentibacter holothuriorum]|uniref:dTDP-4-dehydrorhamnose reductase n=1 Tax=Salegentibacter holothuriorum TaxID=241145 RepID=A0A1T5DR46_9FLAO|nr:dTDP-4-dehydrorhamnose reductase [Salegentibacter holothuriorum]SKB74212.1 dTDP-4-dehydrorhamnose reductase [Salegentibacter holothuriorum]
MKNILVTGAKGQLGSEIREIASQYPDFTFGFTDIAELDITDKNAVVQFIVDNNIDIIINCAAYTAVDKAESEPELAEKINNTAVKYLAEVAKKYCSSIIHISTDYVFDGKNFQPYMPDHPTDPVNMYGETKLEGEKTLKKINPSGSVIIRTSWVYSSFGNNFVKTMLRLGGERKNLNVIYDQVGVPTYAADLAKFILDNCLNLQNEEVKTYHYTNEGVCSWYDFAKEIMEVANLNCKVAPIPTASYPTRANRPFYSLMDKTSLKEEFDVEILYWKDSLKDCIEKMAVSIKL